MKTTTKLWIGIAVLALLSPIGLILPRLFRSGGAWGEWGGDELKGLIGYIPKGIEKIGSFWKAPMPAYAFKNAEGAGIEKMSIAYMISAALGTAIVVIAIYAICKFLAKKK